MKNISGRVIRGAAYGRTIGFPTANLDRRQYLRDNLKFSHGVYGGIAHFSGKLHKAGIVIGPLDAKGLPKIEAHLIGYGPSLPSLYGKKLTLEIKKFLRKFRKFSSESELKRAIQKDIKTIKKLIKI